MYRELRCPTPINVSPFFTFNDSPDTNQISRAASLITSAARFAKQVKTGQLDPDMDKTAPIDMSQYQNLFATRIPHSFRDTLHRSPKEARHVIVLYRDNFFSVDILDPQGNPLSKSQIEQALKTAVTQGSKHAPQVGMFTSEDRSVWSGYKSQLAAIDKNQASLQQIEDSLFAVCLDDFQPKTLNEMSPLLLHSDGSNRYFDKSLQIVVFGNGKAGVVMEHSGIDGHTVIRFATDVYRGVEQAEKTSGGPAAAVKHLPFQLNDSLTKGIAKAKENLKALTKTTDSVVLDFHHFGKKWITSNKLSPDGVVQMAIQLAYYKQNRT